MADAILMSGGVGGVTSDDVTARREHVLQGYTALTSDSDDEPAQGTMVNRGNGMDAVDFTNAHWESKFVARMEEGYYSQVGQWKPYVAVPYSTLARVVGVDRAKMLDTLTIAGKQGQIKTVDTGANNYRLNKSTSFGLDSWTNPSNPVFYVDFPHGNAYYNRPDGHPHVCIDAVNLGDVTPDKVMRGFTATSKNGVRFAGTMPDYSSGRTVFNGATFDGTLASGVATKGFYANGTYYAYNIQSGYAYGGIYGGGMNLQLNTTYTALRSRRIGCVLSQSINVTPFRQIVIYYRSVANIQGNPYASLEAHVSRASVRGQVNVSGTIVDTIDVVRQGTASPAINREGQIVLDVSAINEHIFLSFGAFCNQDRASDIFAGAVQITRVDFLN